jgi:hypothetical protein
MGTSNIGRELDMCGQTALMGTSNIGRELDMCAEFVFETRAPVKFEANLKEQFEENE